MKTYRKRKIKTCYLYTCIVSSVSGIADYDCFRLVRGTAEAQEFVAPDGVVEYYETKDELDLVVVLCTLTLTT